MTKIAFIGVGAMGLHMAGHQVRAGREVAAFDLSSIALERAVERGCSACGTAADAVRGADAVISMLPAGPNVRQLYLEDVLPNARPDALLVDCSTIDVDTAREVSRRAAEAGFRFADAPVSGGMVGAEAGTLAFMVGCQDEDFAAFEDLLGPMARAVIHAGGAGAGQAAKICNNVVLGVSMLGVCEAFALAERLGLDWDRFYDIASKSSAQCWALTANCPVPGPVPTSPANRAYAPGFSTALMLKDLKLAQAAAASAGAATPMGAQAEGLYALFDRLGHGGKDFSAILHLVRGDLGELG